MAQLSRGLDLSNLGEMTQAEVNEFTAFHRKAFGAQQKGFEFWLEHQPSVLKAYRAFADAATQGNLETEKRMMGFFYLEYYALNGFAEGIRYLIRNWQFQGCNKTQVLEGVALAFLHAGPRGMVTIAEAFEGLDWPEPKEPARFPNGWTADPRAFDAGLDYSTLDLSPDELKGLEGWYERNIGYVPKYVPLAARERPRVLKAHRYRFEHCIQTLPKQILPVSLLHFNVLRCHSEGIRENLLLAKSWGVTKDVMLRSVFSPLLNVGIETLSLVEDVVGPLIKSWD